jgi:hypothetical protein
LVKVAIRKVQENQAGLKLNGTYQLLVYADNVNLLEDDIDTIKKSTVTSIDASKAVGLGVNAKKLSISIYCCLITRMQKKNHNVKTANRSCENVAHFKYLGTTVTNQKLIQEEIDRRLNSGDASYQSV